MTQYAAAWNKWFPVIERAARDVSVCMLEKAGVAPGDRVLDLATGIGEPALTAADMVGPGGHVLAVDISTEMIDFARARAEAAGLANIELRVEDVEALALSEVCDVVLCRWGLMFVDDLAGTLGRVHAALKPGGRLAMAVWGPAGEAPTLGLAERVAHRILGLPPPDAGAGTPFALSDVTALVSTLETAGFTAATHQPVNVAFEFSSPEEFVVYRRELSTRFVEAMAGQDAEKQNAVHRAVMHAVEDYRGDGGGIRMVNRAYCVVAVRP